ncbi:hypothetical protein FA10DRAFT_282312 [Acaromyces ingoldii]|uniref:Uncharacterized protein n=1 Tax=Acaromyces ingoldii TaxID=215250 RepID=A0A316YT94_9BASI|nr:hypothetical protein FA10DRAFT_282312 [Acaromyces ingoldii]PWN92627.1 hypothetical protein FA10DRAFT_282312 [Acaromyces ingoldii]
MVRLSLLTVALSATLALASPLPQTDYGGVTKTPELEGLNALLAGLQGSLEKLTQALHGRQRRDAPELNLEDTILSSVPELVPLITDLGIPAGNH